MSVYIHYEGLFDYFTRPTRNRKIELKLEVDMSFEYISLDRVVE